MKRIILFFAFTFLIYGSGYCQDIAIQLRIPGSVVACSDNLINLDITFNSNISLGADHLYFAVLLGDNQKILSSHYLNTSFQGFAFIDLGTGTIDSGLHSYSYTLKILCEQIPQNNTPQNNFRDSVMIFRGQANAVGVSSFTGSWILRGPTGAINNAVEYPWSYPLFSEGSANSFITPTNEIDYIYIDNDTVFKRVSTYINGGTGVFRGEIDFSSVINNSSIHISNVDVIHIDQFGNFNLVFNHLPADTTFSCAFYGVSFNVNPVLPGEIIRIEETLDFWNYNDTCILDGGVNSQCNSILKWGCYFDTSRALCRAVSTSNFIVQGPKSPEILVQRIQPVGFGNTSIAWDTSNSQDPVSWRFLISNSGDDVAKDVVIGISNSFPLTSFYYIPDTTEIVVKRLPSNVIIPHLGTAIRLNEFYLPDTFNLIPKPYCLTNEYPNAVFKMVYEIGNLNPGEQIEVDMSIVYCCPSNDDGGINSINGYSIFHQDKTLNSWQISIIGYDECESAEVLTLNTDTSNGLFTTPIEQFFRIADVSINKKIGDAADVSLKQDFIPAPTEFSPTCGVDTACACGVSNTYTLRNTGFNKGTNVQYLLNSANIFSNTYNPDTPATMLVHGKVRFEFEMQSGIKLIYSNGGPPDPDTFIIFQDNLGNIWNSTGFTVISETCDSLMLSKYRIEFDVNNLPGDGNTLTNFYDFMSNSTLTFILHGCCCNPANTNPVYTIKTFVSGRDENCFIPMNKVQGGVSIHCPGCTTPGITITGASTILERTNFDFEDPNNVGVQGILIDTATYSRAGDLNRSASIVGDNLKTIVNARIEAGSGVSLSQLPVTLDHLFLEVKIPYSNDDQFGVNLYRVDIQIRQGATVYQDSFTALNTPNWNSLYNDYRAPVIANGTPKDIIFLNLSEEIIHTNTPNGLGLTPDSFHFQEGDSFVITLYYQVCHNYSSTNFISNSLSDNRFISHISLNMYLTAEPLTDLQIYDAYTGAIRPVAQEIWNGIRDSIPSNCNWLWVCETQGGIHVFYTLRTLLTPLINYLSGTEFEKCQNMLQIIADVSIGGESVNAFPFEYRPIPDILNFTVNMPNGNDFFTFDTSGANSGSIISSYEVNCFPAFQHQASLNPIVFPGNGIIQYQTRQLDSALQTQYLPIPVPPNCLTTFPNSTNDMLGGDERLLHKLFFRFSINECATNSSIFAPEDYVTMQLDINRTHCSTADFIVSSRVQSYNIITPSNPLGFELVNMADSVNIDSTFYSWRFSLRNYNTTVGSGTDFLIDDPGVPDTVNTDSTFITPFGNFNGGGHEQYLIRASELLNAQINIGESITSISFILGRPYTSAPLRNFQLNLAHTALNSITTLISPDTLINVIPTTVYTPRDRAGLLTLDFTTPFVWDGRNIIVDVSFLNCTTCPLCTSTQTRNGIVVQEVTPFASTVTVHGNNNCTINTLNPAGVQIQSHAVRPLIAFGNRPILNNHTVENPFIYVPEISFLTYSLFDANGVAVPNPQVIAVAGDSVVLWQLPNISYGLANIANYTLQIGFSGCPSCIDDSVCLSDVDIFYGWNCDSATTVADIQSGNVCSVKFQHNTINFLNSIVSTNESSSKGAYILCETDTLTSVLACTGASILDVSVILTINDQNFQDGIDLNSFQFFDNNDTVSYTPFPITAHSPTYTFDLLLPNGLDYGESIIFQFMSTLQTPGIIEPPFQISYIYQSYCGNVDTVVSEAIIPYDTIGTACQINITTDPPFLACSGESGMMTLHSFVTGRNPVPPYTFTWSTGANPNLSSAQDLVIPFPLATTTYNVMVEDSNHATAHASVTIEVINSAQCCLPPNFNNSSSNYNFSPTGASQQITITEIFQRYPHLNSTLTTTGIISINGTLVIDQYFNFSGCPNIVLGPGALIDVLPFDTLIVFDSHISSCKEMARGIRAESDAYVEVIGSQVYDSQYGIEARDGSAIKSVGSRFINDYVGVYVNANGTGSPIFVNTEIENTAFLSTAPLVNPYSGQMPTPLTKPFAGIKLENTSAINIGSINGAGNIFTDLNFGIYSTNGNFNVENCSFLRIQKFDAGYRTFPFEMVGSAIFSNASRGTSQIIQTGRNVMTKPDFVDCYYGIHAISTGVISNGNYMINCDQGYRLINGNNQQFEIKQNNIDFNRFGIVSLYNDASISMEYSENILTGGSRANRLDGPLCNPIGILVYDNDASNSRGKINHNTISITPHFVGLCGGIFLNSAGKYQVLGNTLNLDNQGVSSLIGISLQNSSFNTVECNKIYGTRSGIMANNPDVGMQFAKSVSNIISCNLATNTSTGYKFIDYCLDGAGNPTVFRTNDIGNHYTGIYYTGSARVDEQRNAGNQWHIPLYPGWGGLNLNPVSVLNDKYFVDINGSSLNRPNPVTSGWFQGNNGIDENCDLGPTHQGQCPVPIPGGGGFSFARLIEIALDSMSSVDFNEEARWKAKIALYEKLMKMPEYMDSSTVLANFFAGYAGSVIQKIAKMNLDKEELFAGQQSLVQIMSENASIIYNNSVLLKQCEKLLNEGVLGETEKDSVQNHSDILVNNIRTLMTYNNTAFQVLDSTRELKVDLLYAENQTNNGNEIYEKNEKVVNESYFASVAINDITKVFNYAAEILNVAVQCPIAGGPAVHRARSLYFLIDPDMQYDDVNTCLQGGYLYRTSKNITHKSKLYPNPASTEITVVYNVSGKSQLQILDCLGKIITNYELNEKDVSFNFNVGSLANGIYNYRISDGLGVMIDTGQFVVNK